MSFDPSVNVGNVFEVVAVLVCLGGAIWRLRAVEKKVDELKDVVATLARQDQRLQYLEEAIRDLKYGRYLSFAAADPPAGNR